MNKIVEKAKKIVEEITGEGTRCVLGLIDLEGYPTVSTITASKAHGIEDIYFCTGIASNKAVRVENNGRGSVCYSSDEYNITLVGDIKVITDQELKDEMWYAGLANHFEGPKDPDFCVLHFKTRSYNLLVDWNEVVGDI